MTMIKPTFIAPRLRFKIIISPRIRPEPRSNKTRPKSRPTFYMRNTNFNNHIFALQQSEQNPYLDRQESDQQSDQGSDLEKQSDQESGLDQQSDIITGKNQDKDQDPVLNSVVNLDQHSIQEEALTLIIIFFYSKSRIDCYM